MPLGDFALTVDSHLLMEDEKLLDMADTILPYQALFTAMLMQSSGNMKKNFDALKTAEMLYPSERAWGADEPTGTGKNAKKDYEQGKQELLEKFNLQEE